MSTIGFVGGGNMAEALIKGILKAGLYEPCDVLVSDIKPDRREYLHKTYRICAVEHNRVVSSKSDILVLAVKPQNMTAALESIADVVKDNQLVISIAAGIKVEKISAGLGDIAIVRVMPNIPALIGEGASALFANEKAQARLEEAGAIFSAVGKAVVVESEELIDAVTAVSGSGPAYFFLLIEEMIKAGETLGLSPLVAKELVLQTAKGASLLAAQRDQAGESPAELREKVTSPGGTTEAALKVLADGDITGLVDRAIARARERSRELSG